MNDPSRFISWVYTGQSIFQVRHGESLKKFAMEGVGFEPTTQKKHGLSTTPLLRYQWSISPIDHLPKVNPNSLPKRSLITALSPPETAG